MIFTSAQFVVFFVLFFTAYGRLSGRARSTFLLAASYLFYACWDARFLALLAGSSLIDFFLGQAVARDRPAGRARRWVALSAVANLTILGFFKYCDFFVGSAASALALLGVDVPRPALELVLPVGISFYTFQSMGYVVDVYRGRLGAARSLLDFLLYVSFFPQLVAGPIERAERLLPQLSALDRPAVASGWALIALGAFKKAVIADHMAPLVAAAYADPGAAHAPALWLGTYAFATQIYCDFSGYSDIAVGLARLMGIELTQNFRAPYAADDPSDFWQRWHISLSSWLRDYLYIPLGGNRGGRGRTARNLLLTMLLGGLWHGAAWNFVLWGAYHGLLLLLFRARWMQRWTRRPGPRALVLLRRVAFFQLVCLSWVLFRAPTLGDCGALWSRMLDPRGWQVGAWLGEVRASGEVRYLAVMLAVMLAMLAAQNARRGGSKALVARLWRAPFAVRVGVVLTLLVVTVLLCPEAPPPFIYFQF